MPEWLSPSLAYEVPLWLLSRLQQTAFRGGKEGADAYANAASRYQNEGVNPITANVRGAVESVGPALRGAASAFNPWSEDVSGSQLTEDFTGNRWVDKGLGLGLDLTADPLNAPLGAAGKVAGTIARTAPNLMRLKRAARAEEGAGWVPEAAGSFAEQVGPIDQMLEKFIPGSQFERTANSLKGIEGLPERQAAWKMLDDSFGIRKWLLDIPVAPRGDEALTIRAPGGNVNHYQEKLFGTPTPKGYATRGAYRSDVNTILYNRKTQRENLPHESTHWGREKTPEPFQRPTRAALKDLALKNPEEVAKLRAMPAYADWPTWGIGEEMVSRRFDPEQIMRSPLLRKLVERAESSIRPEHYQDASRIPLEMVYNTLKMSQRPNMTASPNAMAHMERRPQRDFDPLMTGLGLSGLGMTAIPTFEVLRDLTNDGFFAPENNQYTRYIPAPYRDLAWQLGNLVSPYIPTTGDK